MKTLLEDYERRLKTVLSELKKCELNIEKETRLSTKASCYKTFIIELTKQLTLSDVVVPKGTLVCEHPLDKRASIKSQGKDFCFYTVLLNLKIMRWIAIRLLTYQINKTYLKKINTKESFLIRAYEDMIKAYKNAIMFLEADSK